MMTNEVGSQPLKDARVERFAQDVAALVAQRRAYMNAFPRSERWKRVETVDSRASEMAARIEVRQRIAWLKAEGAKSAIFTLADHLDNLRRISEKALDGADYQAAARAEEARGKAAGFYVQRHELTGRNGGPIESKQTRDLTDDELAAELAKRGIPWDGKQ